MLYFGALHKDEPIQVSEDIVHISAANSTYAYALRDTVFDDFIELNRRAETVSDNNSLVLQKNNECQCYCRFFNRKAIQIPGGRGEEGSGKIGPLLSLHAEQRFRVFQSPNRALRLK